MMKTSRERPLSIAMLALGGQGGGVLTGWLVQTAEANGFLAQSTYVAGVAQRTGATVYCVEMFPADKAAGAGRMPVFTPYPIPGDVDLVIAGELAETGRAIEKGFVTPNVTTLIASSHRVYSMPEKEALGDGIVDLAPVEAVAASAAKNYLSFDMQKAADDTGSIISSVMLGAIAASGALPFGREAFEETIRQTGKAVEANLRGFAAGYDGALGTRDEAPGPATPRPAAVGPEGEALFGRIDREVPEPARNLARHGALRLLEYQDAVYAGDYLDRLAGVARRDDAAHEFALTGEVARQLALQMAYEDTVRVADLKTRAERFARIREQLGAAAGQPMRVVEYFHPRLEEFCDTLPAALGERLAGSDRLRRWLGRFFDKGRNITTTSVSGYLFLRLLARLKRFRRGSYRFARQQAMIDDWLQRVSGAHELDYDLAMSIARCIEIVRGYGETYERGLSRYRATLDATQSAPSADTVSRLHRAALADESGEVFRETLRTLEARA